MNNKSYGVVPPKDAYYSHNCDSYHQGMDDVMPDDQHLYRLRTKIVHRIRLRPGLSNTKARAEAKKAGVEFMGCFLGGGFYNFYGLA